MRACRVCPSEVHSLPSSLPAPVRADGLFGRGLTVQSRVPCKGCGRNETDTGPLETSEKNFPVTVCKRSYRKNNGGWHLNYMEEQWREKGRPAQGRAESGRELESERTNCLFCIQEQRSLPRYPLDGPAPPAAAQGVERRGSFWFNR